MYTISNYGGMIRDAGRMSAYVRALRAAITPESVVLDIGTGTGILAQIAAQLGARRVFAIEPSESISIAREIASANPGADRVEFFQALSTELTLPERATVLVSDLRGILPQLQKHIVAIADARSRHLLPGAVQIPMLDRLWTCVVEAPEQHREVSFPWLENPYGLDMRAASHAVANSFWRAAFQPSQLLTDRKCCEVLDYRTIVEPDMHTEVSLRTVRSGVGHGLAVWFDAELADGISFSNAPGAAPLVYGNAFFPWPRPVALREGDLVELGLRADLLGDDYTWSWRTRITCAGEPPIEFRQSDFFGDPMSADRLNRQSADHRPRLDDQGKVDALILRLMGEQLPLGEIAREVAVQFPARFARVQDALTHVGEMSVRYSR